MNKYVYISNSFALCLIYLHSLTYNKCIAQVQEVFIILFIYKLFIQLYLCNHFVYDTIDKWYNKEKLLHIFFVWLILASIDSKCFILYFIIYFEIFYCFLHCFSNLFERLLFDAADDIIELNINESLEDPIDIEDINEIDNLEDINNLNIPSKTIIEIHDINHKYDTMCIICLDEFDTDVKYQIKDLCTHVFHDECITNWLKQKNECPICRL
tara:strand:- start:18538 stop:19173 length:636 start_codon:yes stop_codon:yes gene_type:complete